MVQHQHPYLPPRKLCCIFCRLSYFLHWQHDLCAHPLPPSLTSVGNIPMGSGPPALPLTISYSFLPIYPIWLFFWLFHKLHLLIHGDNIHILKVLLRLHLSGFLLDISLFSICPGFWQHSQMTPTLFILWFHLFIPHLNFVTFWDVILACFTSHNVSLWFTITCAIINYCCIWAHKIHMLRMSSQNPYPHFHPYSVSVLVLSLKKKKTKQETSLMIHRLLNLHMNKGELTTSLSLSLSSFFLSSSNTTTLEVCSLQLSHNSLLPCCFSSQCCQCPVLYNTPPVLLLVLQPTHPEVVLS